MRHINHRPKKGNPHPVGLLARRRPMLPPTASTTARAAVSKVLPARRTMRAPMPRGRPVPRPSPRRRPTAPLRSLLGRRNYPGRRY